MTPFRRLTLAWLVAALVAATLSVPAAQTPPQAASGRGFIWEIARDGRTGWLVGSLHLATPEFYPLPASMEQAFARADTLMEEIDMDDAASPEFAGVVLSKAMYPAGTTFESQVSKETFTRASEWLARAGLPVAAFQQMKPWMVSLTVQALALQRLGFDPAHGIDKHYRDGATRDGKRFVALETAAEQIDFLDRLSATTQDVMLRESLESIDTELAEIKALAAAWRAGDAAAVERIALSGFADAPEVYKSLLVDRNHRWMPEIESCVQTRACFVVVGAAHLVGPDGLVALLRARGYSVEQR
jgi:uncharacterized protein YbaP (TraB family)